MNLHPVNSSRISAVGWENDTLYIRFHNGALYAYDGVSRQEYNTFLSSSSLGSALARLEKRHPYHPVS